MLSHQSSAVHSRRGRNLLIGKLFLVSGFVLAATFGLSQIVSHETTNLDETAVVNDFETRVSHYLGERRKQAGTSPKPTASSEKLDDAQQVLAEKSQQSREEAQRGDIFSPQVTVYFRRQIAAALTGPQGAKIRSSLRHAEPIHEVHLHVNQVYPRELPLQSMPASLLLRLPQLPKELHYRIVGRNLVLLDVAPKLIVDFIQDAIPADKD